MTADRLAEIRDFIAENPPTASVLEELVEALEQAQTETDTLRKQVVYYTNQLSERYREIVALKRQFKMPNCEDCGTPMVETGEDGDATCRVCELEALVERLRKRVSA